VGFERTTLVVIGTDCQLPYNHGQDGTFNRKVWHKIIDGNSVFNNSDLLTPKSIRSFHSPGCHMIKFSTDPVLNILSVNENSIYSK
jgi:hypothetical protein